MLGKYVKVDGVQYPNPTQTSESYANLENVNTSESGKDLASAQRLGKLTINFTFQLSSYWKERILADCRKLNVSLIYCGKTYQGRLRASGNALAKNSENSINTNGYWTLNIQFIER
mgnify:CR=1 FL=1